MKKFGECLKQARIEAGMSQGELAKKIGANAQRISTYETSQVEPRIGIIMRIAKALNVSIDDLLQQPLAEKNYKVTVTRQTASVIHVKAKTKEEAIGIADKCVKANNVKWQDFSTYSYQVMEVV